MVILEHEYQKDKPSNEQERYVVVSDWRKYKLFFIEQMSDRPWQVIEDEENDKFVALFKFNSSDSTFVHEATVVEESGYLNGEVYVVGEGGCHEP